MIDHDGVTFAEVEFPLQTGFAVVQDEDGLTVAGLCPQCAARTEMTFVFGTPQGAKGLSRRARQTQLRRVTMYCECGYWHGDRPPESPDTGCGAYWSVDIG
ncbi:hypothetical protein ACIG3E_13770 [Streptomyces sp. NPDC053474]|uniref:hypothetical protein n=1 Tax=Streptomyces sp. NPDC053474 TaxID=3365704 RepID=UPI0037D74BFA